MSQTGKMSVRNIFTPESRLKRSGLAVTLNLDRVPSVNELARLSMYLTPGQHYALRQHVRSVEKLTALSVTQEVNKDGSPHR